MALINNPGTKVTWAEARTAAGTYGQSLQNDFILTQGNGFWNRSRSAEFGVDTRTIIYESDWGGNVAFSYLILDFGQTRASSRSALEALMNANWTHNREIQTVIQSMMNDYYGYLSQKEQVRASEADVENAMASLDAVNEKLRTGLADLGDQVQAKTKLLQAQLNVVSQKQLLVTAYTQLALDLGVPATSHIELQSYPDQIHTFDVANLEKLINMALQSRPDMLAAEADVKSKEAALQAAQRKRFPTVSSSFDYGRTYYNIDSRTFNDGRDWQIAFSLDIPLFQGFFLVNGVKIAKGNLEQSRANFESLQLTLMQSIVNARSDVVFAAEALKYAKEFLEAAEEDFKINLKKYKVGTATILDVISAQTSVSDARSQFVNAEKNWYQSIANLGYATGVLNLPQVGELDTIFKKTSEEWR